jgi:hypothetical protein
MAIRKLGCIHLYVLQIKLKNYINAPRATRKLGCIHLYVMQIKPKNCVNTMWQQEIGLHPLVCGANFKPKNYVSTPWQQENWAASICMWCK